MSQDLSQYPTMNPTFQLTERDSTPTQAQVVMEPLEKGYGHTLGNALRRTMLTSLPGHAVSMIRIDGVDHQYTSLEGMTEDIVEFILNVKQLRIKSDSSDNGLLRLTATGPATVTAADIEVGGGFEIINTDQLLATLAKGKKLSAELTVEAGMGYLPATERQSSTIGDIPVDALFSPVVQVSYRVEQTRVGRRTDYDRVVFNITTDGTLRPIETVRQAARILARQMTQVYEPAAAQAEVEPAELSPQEAEVLRLTVEELDLPTRIANALRKGGFKTVGELINAERGTIAKVKNLGEKSVDVINDALGKKGVSLSE
ncbi:MAG: DNA-directed RNA polymerase subunit alpha [Candidatus Pacebacteria bacterium CG10_big_fil_rev_8_21_14_0_10_56_10]|nr:MAG: DNA-directed RNA polymerase subunit alpha [Candidatus Pacebacteria bacterium CG10_big_fil_rev_8_21_14_0_10_56_10]